MNKTRDIEKFCLKYIKHQLKLNRTRYKIKVAKEIGIRVELSPSP